MDLVQLVFQEETVPPFCISTHSVSASKDISSVSSRSTSVGCSGWWWFTLGGEFQKILFWRQLRKWNIPLSQMCSLESSFLQSDALNVSGTKNSTIHPENGQWWFSSPQLENARLEKLQVILDLWRVAYWSFKVMMDLPKGTYNPVLKLWWLPPLLW